jgi:hypothetical protein
MERYRITTGARRTINLRSRRSPTTLTTAEPAVCAPSQTPRHMWVPQRSVSVLPIAGRALAGSQVGSHSRWTAVDHDESTALSKRPNALMWTLMDAAWRSTDQEVGCSSRPGRAGEIPCVSAGFVNVPEPRRTETCLTVTGSTHQGEGIRDRRPWPSACRHCRACGGGQAGPEHALSLAESARGARTPGHILITDS